MAIENRALSTDLAHTYPQIVAFAARTWGDRPFVTDEDGMVTSFEQLERRVAGVASHLLTLGVAHGDRVAVLAPNGSAWIVAALATMGIGAIMVPVNTRFKGLEIRYVLEKARVCVLFTVSDFLGTDYARMVIDACGGMGECLPTCDLPHLKAIVDIGAPSFAPSVVGDAAIEAYRAAARQVEPDHTADLLFTSGTTGMPKGAMHSHGQALWMPLIWATQNDFRDNDRSAIVNPFFHSFGYRSGWVAALVRGVSIWPLAMFDAGSMLALIERERITQLAGAPTVFASLMAHPDFATRDIASLRTGHTGGAKTPPEIIRAGYTKLGFDIFLTSYGMTEATAMISGNLPDDPLEAIVETVGRPVPGVEVQIVDTDGKRVPAGERGELLVRGPNVMQGYFEDPEQTAKVIDPQGWLHSGDIAAIDTDGRLRILDRMKDVIIVGGFNAYSVEIEIMLAQHPDIAEVAIIGLPDERLGEVTAACVILRGDAEITLVALTAWSRERMANYKVPRHLFVFKDFPRTPLGKVQKFALRKNVVELSPTT